MKPIHSLWWFLIALAIFTLAMNATKVPDTAHRALTAIFVVTLVISACVVFYQTVPTISWSRARKLRNDRRAIRCIVRAIRCIDRANRIQADWMARR